jgi:hypothetical protein
MTSEEEQYLVKTIKLGTRRYPIILQSKNGPCPLLAIVNALILRGTNIHIDAQKSHVSSNYLVDVIGAYLLDISNKNNNKNNETTQEMNISDALTTLMRIKDGLNVNVKFNGCFSFDDIPEMKIFRLLNLKLVHGWLVDPQDEETHRALGDLTYTQAVEKVFLMRDVIAMEEKAAAHASNELQNENTFNDIKMDNNAPTIIASDFANIIKNPEDIMTKLTREQREQIKKEGGLIAQFLESSSSQITYYGLVSLHECLNNNQLAILFRNNHFATICKHNDHLYLLCTDEGFVDKEDIVWERIDEIGGDNIYCKGDFQALQGNDDILQRIEMNEKKREEQRRIEERDLALAMQLQREEEKRARQYNTGLPSTSNSNPQQQIIHHNSSDQQIIQQAPSAPSYNHANIKPTPSIPYGNVPTIRQKAELAGPKKKKTGNDRYKTQAQQLAELNADRIQREQNGQSQAARQRAAQYEIRSRGDKKDRNNCCIQ